MKIAASLLPFLACIVALLAAQVAGLLGFVGAMRLLWLLAVVCGALAVLADGRHPPDY